MALRRLELYGDKFKAPLGLLSRKLGPTDAQRLADLAGKAVAPGGIPLLDCLTGEGTPQQQQAEFRAFRKRVNDAARRAKIDFTIPAGNNKQQPLAARRVTFLGADPAADMVTEYNRATTKDQESVVFVRPLGLKTNRAELESGKLLVRVFVSYSHANATLVEKFITLLKEHEKSRSKYEFQFWYDPGIRTGDFWDARIQKAIEESVAGVFLVSQALLGSKYFVETELPPYLKGERYIFPVGLSHVDLDRSDLHGIEERQILRHERTSFFEDLAMPQRHRFVDKLVSDIELVLDEGSQALTGTLTTKPNAIAPKIYFPKEEDGIFIDPHAFRWTAADMDRYDPAKAEGNRRDLCRELLDWACDTNANASRYCALMGEVGMGKTTTLKHITGMIADQRATNNLLPLPIYLDLRYYDGSKIEIPAVEQIIDRVIQNSWRAAAGVVPTGEDVVRLVREDDALMIFDGLDEQLVAMTPATGRVFLRKLWSARANSPRGRIIVSCRSHYFRDIRSQNSALTGDDREGIRKEDFPIFCLLPFNEIQIGGYLASTLGSDEAGRKALEMLESIHNLRDLAERPYLLKLLAPRLAELEALQLRGKAVNAARLYELVIDSWLNRDEPKHQINIAHKRILMEELAAAFWRSGEKRWPVDKLERWFDRFLAQNPSIALAYPDTARDILKEDLRTATFVLRPDTESNSFGFAHTSLQEFFLALYLVRALDAEEEANPAARWSMTPVASWETFEFAGQLLQNSGRPGLVARLHELLGGNDLAAAVQAFRYWVTAVRHKYPVPTTTHQVNLAGANLEEWQIADVNLRGANLRGARLNRARLERVDLSGSDLREVQAREAVFIDVAAESVQGSGHGMGDPKWRNRNAKVDGPALGLERVGLTQWKRPQAGIKANGAAVPFLSSDHSTGVTSCAYSPSGDRVLSASYDRTLKLWDAHSGECLLTFSGHSHGVMSCAYSPSGDRVLSASFDGTLKLWDAHSGECLLTFSGHSNMVTSCAYSPSGDRVLSASWDGTLKLWDAHSGECLLTFSGHSDGVFSCAYSPSGDRVLSASYDGTLKLWDAHSGECLLTFSGHSNWVSSCAYSPSGDRVLSASYDRTLKLWDAHSGECLLTFSDHSAGSGHSAGVTSCAYSPSGDRVLSASDDQTLKLWDAHSGECLLTFSGHSSSATSCAFSPDAARILSASRDHTLKLWDAHSGECLSTFSHLPEGNAVAWTPSKFLWASPEAWRWLGLQVVTGEDTKRTTVLLPCDAFERVPGLAY